MWWSGPPKNIREFIHGVDCKPITAENMKQLGDILFISRFPTLCKGHDRVIGHAIEAGHWKIPGVPAEPPDPSINRQRASNKARESQVTINENNFRAIIIQTGHRDKRRSSFIERKLLKERPLAKKNNEAAETESCPLDAARALETLTRKNKTACGNLTGTMEKPSVHDLVRAPANDRRKIMGIRYHHRLQLAENTGYHQQKLANAGSLVIISKSEKHKRSAREVLITYKARHGVKKNFSFLKEPRIANDTFLNKSVESVKSVVQFFLRIPN